jgi:hypothetical protein
VRTGEEVVHKVPFVLSAQSFTSQPPKCLQIAPRKLKCTAPTPR